MGFKPGNPWRWQPGQSGNPAGRTPGIKAHIPCRRTVHPRTQWRKGQSGNPRGRRPGTGIRQRQARLLESMAVGKPYDFDEAVDLLLGRLNYRKGRPRGRPFPKKSVLPLAAPGQVPPATPPPPIPPPPQLPRWLPQFQRPPVPGRDGPDFPRPR